MSYLVSCTFDLKGGDLPIFGTDRKERAMLLGCGQPRSSNNSMTRTMPALAST